MPICSQLKETGSEIFPRRPRLGSTFNVPNTITLGLIVAMDNCDMVLKEKPPVRNSRIEYAVAVVG